MGPGPLIKEKGRPERGKSKPALPRSITASYLRRLLEDLSGKAVANLDMGGGRENPPLFVAKSLGSVPRVPGALRPLWESRKKGTGNGQALWSIISHKSSKRAGALKARTPTPL